MNRTDVYVKFLGHACFEIQGDQCSVLVDPFLAPNNPVASAGPGDVEPSHLVLTHGHEDHVADAVAVAQGGIPAIALVEIAAWLKEQGVEGVDVNLGGRVTFEWGWVELVPALHTNTLPDGTVVGQSAGAVICIDGKVLYHTGDTALFSDLKLVAERTPVDVMIVPIGGRYTMDSWAAARAVSMVSPRIAIPCHYNTFPPIMADPNSFASEVAELSGTRVEILDPGDGIPL